MGVQLEQYKTHYPTAKNDAKPLCANVWLKQRSYETSVTFFFYICLIFFHFKKLPIYGKYELGLAKCVLNATRKITLIVDKRKTVVHNIIIIQHNCILQHMQKKPKKQTMRVRSHSSSTVLVVQQVKRHHRCQPSTSRCLHNTTSCCSHRYCPMLL